MKLDVEKSNPRAIGWEIYARGLLVGLAASVRDTRGSGASNEYTSPSSYEIRIVGTYSTRWNV
jgi:hypothetical protein